MEELFELLFGAGGRISRAKYWRWVLLFIIAGLMTAVILFTAAAIAAPFFIIAVIVVLIPWLLWGDFLHYQAAARPRQEPVVARGVLSGAGRARRIARNHMACGSRRCRAPSTLALAALALTIWGFVEIGCLRGSAGSNTYGPDPLFQPKQPG